MKPNSSLRLLLFAVCCALIGSGCVAYYAVDGSADAKVLVWLDANANGIVDPGEKPLNRVKVGMGYPDIFTDENGRASVGEFMPGCASNCWEGETVVVEAPQGYKPTTPMEFKLTGEDQTFQFGFVLDPLAATSTPYSAGLSCKTYKDIEPQGMAIAPDGSLWIALYDGTAKYDPKADQFVSYAGLDGLYEGINIGSNGEVWISTQEYMISRYFDSEWSTWQKESLIAASDVSIGTTQDGRVWFAVQAPPSELASFNPLTNEWRFFIQPEDLNYAVGTKVRASTDNSTWFAAFDDRAGATPPGPTPNIQWKIYDEHSFTKDEIQKIPSLGWIEDSKFDSRGLLWLSTTEGLASYDPVTDNWTINAWPHTNDIYPMIDTSSLGIGPDGSIWIGTSSNNRPLLLRFFPNEGGSAWQTYDDRDGIPNSGGIGKIAFTPDGKLWLSVEGIAGCLVLR
jgi:streptogramin lyase